MQTFELPGERDLPDALQFSPDGRHLAIQAWGRLEVLDTTRGKVRRVYSGSLTRVGTPGVGFTADSRNVIYFKDEKNIVYVFDLATRQKRVLRKSQKVPWCSSGDVSISIVQPDGQLVFVAVSPEGGTVEIVALDPASGEQKFSFARHRSYLRELAVSADGQWVAGCSTHDLRVWGIGGGKLPNRASWHVEDCKSSVCFGNLALTRDGAFLAVGGYAGNGRVRVWNLKAGKELNLKGSSAGGGGVAFAAGRPLLAFTQRAEDVGEVVIWDAQARTERERFDWGVGPVRAVAFSLDGFRCATASKTKAVVWDVDI